MSGHLTDEQFSAILAGQSPGPEGEAHLVACAPCRKEVASVGEAAQAFSEISLAWAQGQAPRTVHPPSRLAQFLGGRPAWGAAVTATVAVSAIAFGLGLPFTHAHPAATDLRVPAMPSTAEIAEDNRLLASIEGELQSGARPPFSAAELRAPVRGQRSHAHGTDGQ